MSREMQVASPVETSTYGTVTHMPPELLSAGKLSRHADVYSFGVILNEMYCGALAGHEMALPFRETALVDHSRKGSALCATSLPLFFSFCYAFLDLLCRLGSAIGT